MTSSSPADAQTSIAERVAEVRARIDAACRTAGRDTASVTLTAVSKTQEPAAIDEILATGQRVFGENRVQEAHGRWTHRLADRPDLELRLIGPLQTNKAEDAVALFAVIETVDRDKLAHALDKAARKQGKTQRVLVQVNTGAEPQKAGVLPADADALVASVRALKGLSLEGLMCIPPAEEDPCPHFALLSEMAALHGLSVLSMGMSGDYEAAIRHGATHVRVGTALFGERNRSETAS